MNTLDRIRRYLAPEDEAEKPKTIDARVAGQKLTYFGARQDKSAEYRRIYEQGGCVSTAIDAYPLFMLSNGYRLEGGSPKDQQKVRERFDAVDIETKLWTMIVDALVVNRGVAEIAPKLGGKEPVGALYTRPGEQFAPLLDDYGRVTGWKQVVTAGGRMANRVYPPEILFIVDLGLPLMQRAYDDIIRDTKIAEGTAKSIERHGFPRYHVKVGETGEYPTQTEIDSIGSAFEDLKPQHEMATAGNVKIENIDNQGVPNAKLYGEWATMRLATALGIPEELLGLGRGSTEATATVKLQAWYDTIGTRQRMLARQINTQLTDRITGVPGLVKLIFNDVSPSDDQAKAQFVATVMAANQIEPIMGRDEAREYLGLAAETQKPERMEQVKEDVEQGDGDGQSELARAMGDPQVQGPKRRDRKGAKGGRGRT